MSKIAVLLHGLCCSSQSTWGSAEGRLPGWDIRTVDYRRGVAVEAAGIIMAAEQENPDQLLLIGHSMGGAIAVMAAEYLGAACISVEGNLTSADCGLLSRDLGAGKPVPPEMMTTPGFDWDAWAPQERTVAAASLVMWSDSGELARRWERIPQRLYISGDSPSARDDITPAVRIPGAGHWPMLDQPDRFWQAAEQFAQQVR